MNKENLKLSSDMEDLFRKRLENKIKDINELLKIFDLKSPELSLAMYLCNKIFIDSNKGVISYSKNVFLPLTSYCRNNCGYCYFRAELDDDLPIYITEDQILSILKLAEKEYCKEALLTMGEKPEEKYPRAREALKDLGGFDSTIDYLYHICKIILDQSKLLPHSNPGIIDYDELKLLKEVNASLGLMLENVSPRLMEKGGPHEHSPGKNPELRVKVIENAGKLKIPFTTGILIGIGETKKEIINSLMKIEEINQKYGHIQEIIIQGYNPPFNDNEIQQETLELPYSKPSVASMIKTIIVAKLITDIPIQTPPNLLNSFQPILFAGIDDWGGISPLTPDFINPNRPWPKINEILESTQELGYQMKERLPIYPKFISKEFIHENLQKRIFKLVNKDGFVK
jgi:FO synthase subunit 1